MKACRGAWWLGWAALFLGVAVGRVCAQTVDGSKRLEFTAGTTGRTLLAGTPSIGADGTIYFGVEFNTNPPAGRVYAITPDGRVKWSFNTPNWVDSAPAISADGSAVYFGCWDGKVYALNAASGAKLWEFVTTSYIVGSPAIGVDGVIYAGSGDGVFRAISPNGSLLWSYTVGGAIESSPAVAADGSIYFGAVDQNIYALAPDGKLKWRLPTVGPVYASPAVGYDGTVYVGSYGGVMYAVNAEGTTQWTFRITDGFRISASPVLGPDGTVYFGGEDRIFYAVAADGRLKWQVGVGGVITASAAVRSDGLVIVPAYDGVVRALYTDEPRSGVVKWSYKTGDAIEGAPTIARDGTVYVGSFDGKLYGFNGSGSPASEFSAWPTSRRNTECRAAQPARLDGGRLLNLATRATAGDSNSVILGLVTSGLGAKEYLIRGVGPALEKLGVPNPLVDPALAVRALASETVLLANDDWMNAENAAQIREKSASVGAFPLPEGGRDSAVLGALSPGAYTAALTTDRTGTGVALVEVYDANPSSTAARLNNLSTRAQVGIGDGVLIPGLVVGGTGPIRVLVRAIGPALATFGVERVLARPTMTIFAGATAILSNTGWSSNPYRGDVAGAASLVGAFPLAEGSSDCAAMLTLNPGNYTIQVSGVGGTTGEALVEVYVLP